MLLLDTSVLIALEHELSRGEVGPVRLFFGRHRSEDLAFSTVTVGELAVGTPEESVRFFLRRLRKIPLSEAIAYRAGALDAALLRKGKRLDENDNSIAATALHYAAIPVVRRRHCSPRTTCPPSQDPHLDRRGSDPRFFYLLALSRRR